MNFKSLFYTFIFVLSQLSVAQLKNDQTPNELFESEQKTLLIPRVSISGTKFELRLGDQDKLAPCNLFGVDNFPNNWFMVGSWDPSYECESLKEVLNLYTQARSSDSTFLKKLSPTQKQIHLKKNKIRRRQVDLTTFLMEVNKFIEAPYEINKISKLFDDHQVIKNSVSYLLAHAAVQRRLGNRGGLYRNIYHILSTPRQFFVIVNEIYATSSDNNKSESELMKILAYLKENALAEKEFHYLSLYLEGVLPQTIIDKLDSNISLNDLRVEISNYKWGVRFPYIWINELKRRSTAKEQRAYFDKVFKFIKTKKDIAKIAEILRFAIPSSKEKRELVIEYMKDLLNEESLLGNYLLVSTLENPDLVNLLDRFKLKVPPLFSLKRRFYTRLLEDEFAINYALHRLLVIGDRSKDLIWWKIL